MKIREVMSGHVVRIHPEESVEVAARTLAQFTLRALPVCTQNGNLLGVVTDRDLVIRCLAAGKMPAQPKVREVMTNRVHTVAPDTETGVAAHLMGRQQVRRLAVTENGRLCGMVSLGDLANREDTVMDAADALGDIVENISHK